MSRIWNITPFDPKKRLGKVHNDFVSLLPDGDYVMVTDPDIMFLQPDTMRHIHDIVEEHGHEWDLLGCMTNRIGVGEQLALSGELSLEWDIRYHGNICKTFLGMHGHSIAPAKLVAGFLMVFKKSLWEKTRFEEGIDFDTKFCGAVASSGGRIGIMRGIYVFHNYRLFAGDMKYKKHLLS